MLVLVATALGIGSVQEALGGRSMASWWTPFVLGLGLGAFPCLVWIAVTSADGSATWRIGADAEAWTAEELRGLGSSWHIEHAVPFPEHGHPVDIDHVAVGPHGVLAVETKWTSHAVDLTAKRLAPEVEKAVRQAGDNAGRVSGLLRRVDPTTKVIPVVVYWGPNVIPPTTPVRREGDVRLVAGKQGAGWRPLLSLDRLDPGAIDQLAARVRDWRVQQERKTVGTAVATLLHKARTLGRVSLAFTVLMVVLLPASRAPGPVGDVLDAMFTSGGAVLAGISLFLPLAVGLGSAVWVCIARRLDPDVPWLPNVIPLGVWVAGFIGLLLAT